MISRLYLFILLGTLVENSHYLWQVMGYDDDFIFYTVFPTCQRLEIALLPAWWISERLWPVKYDQQKELWSYLIAVTYLIFQILDAVDMYINANTRPAWIDFVFFIGLNISYWVCFRFRSP